MSTGLRRLELIGEGAQGKVWLCDAANQYGKPVVEKEMEFASEDDLAVAERHGRAIMCLNNEHLIRYLQVTRTAPRTLSVVMPYFKEKDLKTLIENMQRPLPDLNICSMVLQLASALAYMHDNDFIHGDVKPENVLMFDEFQRVLLMDLDASRQFPPWRSASQGLPGAGLAVTQEYAAPELCGNAAPSAVVPRITGKCDVFSLGIVFFSLLYLPEFVMLKHPQTNETMLLNAREWTPLALRLALEEFSREQNVSFGKRPTDPRIIELLVLMLRHDANARADAATVKAVLHDLMGDLLLGGGGGA